MTVFLSRLVLAVFLAAVVSAPLPRAAADPASLVQSWLDSWTRLGGRFQQVVSSPTLPREQVESGQFEIARPDRMRWDYQIPETKLAVTDGHSTWLYLPEDRQVVRGSMEALRRDGAMALLLSGTVTLTEAFRIMESGRVGDRLELTLEPRVPSQSMARIDLAATAAGQILFFTVHDAAGNRVQWSFSDLRLDPPMDDRRFQFTIPPGVEVQDLEESGGELP
jgi:outer membrane lipoprotein carrier protein